MTASLERKPARDLPPDIASELENLLIRRYSCRAYKDQPVPRPVIEQVLSMAQLTASWCNTQPWRVIITSGEETEKFRTALFAYAQGAVGAMTPDLPFPARYEGVYLDRKRECGYQLYNSVGIGREDRTASARQAMENFRMFGAPHVAIVTTERDLGVYGAVDCGAYVSNFMLAAQALGLGCIAQAALAACAPFIREYFSLPDNRLVVCGISFGYADDNQPINSFRTRRAGLEHVVEWKE
jgi:nitroreductase